MAEVTVTTEDGKGNIIETRVEQVPDAVVNAPLVRAKVEATLDALESADEAWDALGPAQRTAAMRLAVRAVAGLARLQSDRLEKS